MHWTAFWSAKIWANCSSLCLLYCIWILHLKHLKTKLSLATNLPGLIWKPTKSHLVSLSRHSLVPPLNLKWSLTQRWLSPGPGWKGSAAKFPSDGDLFLCTIWWFFRLSATAIPQIASLSVAAVVTAAHSLPRKWSWGNEEIAPVTRVVNNLEWHKSLWYGRNPAFCFRLLLHHPDHSLFAKACGE